jgi:small subunit ribosomal protein S11
MGRTREKIVSGAEVKETVVTQKKKINLPVGRIYITSSHNNIKICLTDDNGNVIAWSSAGHAGFKHTKKGTPYAGAKAMEVLLDKISNVNIGELKVFVKGIGPGRDPALRVLFSKNYNITYIADITPIPFGGPTPPKPRRV